MTQQGKRETLWGVSILGPDDVFAVRDYSSALEIANRFNAFWTKRTKKGLHEFDPLMWAIPCRWPHSTTSHANDLNEPSHEYINFIRRPSFLSRIRAALSGSRT